MDTKEVVSDKLVKQNNDEQQLQFPSLSDPLFNTKPLVNTFFHTWPDNNRFVSNDIWRPPQMFGPQSTVRQGQLGQGEQLHLAQPLIPDFVANTDRMMLLVKTGAMTIWNRLPMHFLTQLAKFSKFAIYSDAADSVAGYEVIDILANLSVPLLNSEQFELYRHFRDMRARHSYLAPQDTANLFFSKDARQKGWTIDKFKNLPMLLHAFKSTESSDDIDWYVMIDDDTMLIVENLVRLLSSLDPTQPYYLGSAVAGLQYIFAHGGSGIVLSRKTMEIAFSEMEAEKNVQDYSVRAQHECCGDYMVAMYLKELYGIALNYELSRSRFQGEPLHLIQFGHDNWCQELISLHHVGPRDMEVLWEYERIRQYELAQGSQDAENSDSTIVGPPLRGITYRDLYNDFVKPYFDRRPQWDWDNGAKDVELSWQADYANENGQIENEAQRPWYSLENCRRECERRLDCLMYRYDPYRRYCGLSSSTIALGATVVNYSEDEDFDITCRTLTNSADKCPKARDRTDKSHQMVSGWYLERVISMRRQIWCDSLYVDPTSDGNIYGHRDQVEGWWVRMQSKYIDEADPLRH